MRLLPGLDELWRRTGGGDPRICIAILDGPVDLGHSCLKQARLVNRPTLVSGQVDSGPAGSHGTHVASIIFGGHDSPVHGIAPHCRGVVVPIFESAGDDSLRQCSQLDLARAITMAVMEGAQIINVSGGEFSPSGQAHPLLADVVAECARLGVLIVAAAGNQGCECLHVPAALDSVLTVGAMDAEGEPLPESNWGGLYQFQGVVAPGQDILGAQPGGGTTRRSGTSFATAIVTGVAALLLSLQARFGQRLEPHRARAALLAGALNCSAYPAWDCRRLLVGRLNVPSALSCFMKEIRPMSEPTEARSMESAAADQSAASHTDVSPQSPVPSVLPSETVVEAGALPPASPIDIPPHSGASSVSPSMTPTDNVQSAACLCPTGQVSKVYVLGQIGYDLISEARMDGFVQKMAGATGNAQPQRWDAFDQTKMLAHLDSHPYEASALEWTLILDGTPVYAIRPAGAYAADAYKQLCQVLRDQLAEGENRVDRMSMPGVLSGKARLLSGSTVPVIVPELRGTYSWNTAKLVEAAVGPKPAGNASAAAKADHERKTNGVHKFLDRVYYSLRNLGVHSKDRAINFAATNAYQIEEMYESAVKEQMELESIQVTPSPFCRPGSDCWDIEVYFFFPERQVQTVRKVYRFTVDVSDVVPVTIGPMREWFTR